MKTKQYALYTARLARLHLYYVLLVDYCMLLRTNFFMPDFVRDSTAEIMNRIALKRNRVANRKLEIGRTASQIPINPMANIALTHGKKRNRVSNKMIGVANIAHGKEVNNVANMPKGVANSSK